MKNNAIAAALSLSALSLMLAACGQGGDDAANGLTAQDAAALDKAAEKLDQENTPTPAIIPASKPDAQEQQQPAAK
ncbi:hypothetical protein ACFOWX_13235 [Sphingorhabdus arenilitoris]|uniref:Secreted protein n=1 Tax=Sphingorhabdus arenilitoris TaxID=1490041 RepID=A0ABV8RJ77_9SPHN